MPAAGESAHKAFSASEHGAVRVRLDSRSLRLEVLGPVRSMNYRLDLDGTDA